MSTEALKTVATGTAPANPVAKFSNFLDKYKPQMALALPRHLNADRMSRLAVTEFAKNEKLQRCSPESIIGSIMTAATLGLEIGVNGAAFLVPYGNTCTCVPGWKGLVDLVSRSGAGTVFTGVIFKDQEYSFIDGARRDLIIHNETDLDAPEDITHAYAIGWVKGAEMPIIELWRVSKISKHRDKYNKVGKSHYSFRDWEMYCRKVPLLQVLKYMPASVEVQRAIDVANAAEEGRAVTINGDFITTTEPSDMGDQSQSAGTTSNTSGINKSTGEITGKNQSQPSDEPGFEDAISAVKSGDFDFARDIARGLEDGQRLAVEAAIENASKPDGQQRQRRERGGSAIE